jgi:sugar lactone lactonase YvrE
LRLLIQVLDLLKNRMATIVATAGVKQVLSGVTAPTQPIVSSSSITSSGFTLTWTGGNNATSYTYSGATPTTDNGVASKTAIFTGLSSGTTYTVTVTAVNAVGSTASAPISVTPRFPTGVTTIAGQVGVFGSAVGTGTQNTFSAPLDGSVDSSGNIYISNTYAHCITKLTPTTYVGSIFSGATKLAGNAEGTSTTATFNFPGGSCIYDGFLYVCDGGSGYIRKVSLTNGSVTNFSITAAANSYITSDGTGTFYYTNIGNGIIYRITSTGTVTTYATAAQTGGTSTGLGGIAYNTANGDIYYADRRSGSGTSFIKRITTGKVSSTVDSSLSFPSGIKFSPDNTAIYYVVTNQHIIKRFIIGGAVSLVTGINNTIGSTNSTTLTSATYKNPYSLAFDPSGLFFYVMDQGNPLIRRVVF